MNQQPGRIVRSLSVELEGHSSRRLRTRASLIIGGGVNDAGAPPTRGVGGALKPSAEPMRNRSNRTDAEPIEWNRRGTDGADPARNPLATLGRGTQGEAAAALAVATLDISEAAHCVGKYTRPEGERALGESTRPEGARATGAGADSNLYSRHGNASGWRLSANSERVQNEKSRRASYSESVPV